MAIPKTGQVVITDGGVTFTIDYDAGSLRLSPTDVPPRTILYEASTLTWDTPVTLVNFVAGPELALGSSADRPRVDMTLTMGRGRTVTFHNAEIRTSRYHQAPPPRKTRHVKRRQRNKVVPARAAWRDRDWLSFDVVAFG